ncbi:hypothetical protein, partial [Acidithiobacillus thiooxidans]|uniref:hypothetical protein n=1 Tax=Acidithiobacillus thiooxidans TaxID=930 RepID=UPI0013896A5D
MEQNKTPHPIGINFFSADTVMHRPEAGAQLIPKPWAGCWDLVGWFSFWKFLGGKFIAQGKIPEYT